MKDIKCEKAPGADLPYSIQMATGDMAAVYAVDSIATVTASDWSGAALSGITVAATSSGTVVTLRISGGTAGQSYQIKIKATLTNPNYVDEVFLTLSVKQPTST